MTAWRALVWLTAREFKRFVRRPSRVVATLGTVGLFWLVIGGGMGASFVSSEGGAGYAGYLVPGMVTMVVLFGTVFAAISLIQDRAAGFLQSALVSPAPRWVIGGSKVAAGVGLGAAQAALLLAAAPLAGLEASLGGFGLAVLAAALAAAGVVGLGVAMAWWVDSVGGFHGLMNLALTPMWLLSGALFPASGASDWLGAVMRANPLHWSTRAMGGALGVGPPASAWEWAGAVAFALAGATIAMTGGRRRAGARPRGEGG